MQRYLHLVWMLLFPLFLTACSYQAEVKFNHDLTRETWMKEIDTGPLQWARGTDAWFLSGDAHAVDTPIVGPPMSTMRINAPEFSTIRSKGDFKVQIFGTEGKNSVYVYGPSQAITNTIITTRGNTLYLNQREKSSSYLMRKVIIRIGVHRLNNLVQSGGGVVEGVRLGSDCLTVISTGCGNVYLAGHMNITLLQNLGSGSVSIFGANTRELDILAAGRGSTNISGNVGVRSIVHHGMANVNIIGANSNHLSIRADGSGKIGVKGIVNLYSLKAGGNTHVYVCSVNSPCLRVTASDSACVGLAGFAKTLYIDAIQRTCVGARDLCANEAYVHTSESAHVNVSAARKIFASASGTSSIYFFGPPDILTRFVKDDGFIIRACMQSSNCPVLQKVRDCPPELVGAG